MKSLILIACAALMSAGTVASAADSAGAAPREKALMLYFTKSFGSNQRQNRTPLAFGLRLQETSRIDLSRSYDLFDLRYSLGGRTTLGNSGALMYDSYNHEYWKNPWAYIGIGAAIFGGLCLAEEWPCESNDNESTTDTVSPGIG